MNVRDEGYEIVTIQESQPHPYYLPNFQNAFDFSLPHLAILAASLLSCYVSVMLAEGEGAEVEKLAKEKVTAFRNDFFKVCADGRGIEGLFGCVCVCVCEYGDVCDEGRKVDALVYDIEGK